MIGKNELFILLLSLFICTSTSAEIFNIPEDYTSIQLAIDAASSTDTLVLADGTYWEHLTLTGKSLTLASEFLQDGDSTHMEHTRLQGNNNNRIINVHGDSSSDISLTIIGLTLRDGDATKLHPPLGGAILLQRADLVIETCRFTNCRAENGAALSTDNGNVEIRNCMVDSCTAKENLNIILTVTGNFKFESTLYKDNVGTPLSGRNGGGIVRANHFFRNSTQGDGGGAHLTGEGGYSWLIVDNMFQENRARFGGGISVARCDSLLIEKNQFIANVAFDDTTAVGGNGGAIEVLSSNYCLIRNNHFERNIAYVLGGALKLDVSATIEENRFKGNLGGIVSCLFATPGKSRKSSILFRRNGVTEHKKYRYKEYRTEYQGAISIYVNTSLKADSNTFMKNLGLVLYTYQQADKIDVQNNYWGAENGPYHSELNPVGTGDSLDVRITESMVQPWAVTPFHVDDPQGQ